MQDIAASLTGNVGTDVELAQGEGWARASFRLGSTPRHLHQGQWVDGETTWISVNCWGRLAQHVKASIAKGDPVLVQGKLRTSAWLKDGVRQERLVVEASAIGHDLSRGRSVFERSVSRVRAADGTTMNPATGEIFPESHLRAGMPGAEQQVDVEDPRPEADDEFEDALARERDLAHL